MILRFRSLNVAIHWKSHAYKFYPLGTHWIPLEILIPFVKTFLYPEESTYCYWGLLGTNWIQQVTEIRVTKFWSIFKSTHITRAFYWELNEFTKKQCFSSLKRCSILNNKLITCESYWKPPVFIVILRFRSVKCCYILKSTIIQACPIGNSLNSPRNFDSIRENFSIFRRGHLLLLRPIWNYPNSRSYWDSANQILINL